MQNQFTKTRQKVKTKGRFTMDFATNGKLFNVDANWAKIANPEAH